ncbi:hypothetical protein M5J74_20255 [Chroococcidiopsis sp. CCNUC1]|nr:hypothetical protein [Chroococcidiopsis sp. CCNUC1]URD48656.1 hypothetical protein M5J74_20255 [Chroococcidiopsis sp. CCNUC1]
MVNVANGDARSLLNALELAVETTPPGDRGTIHIVKSNRRLVYYSCFSQGDRSMKMRS